MNTAKIRVLEKELADATTAARAGGSWSSEHRRRAWRLRKAILNLKFAPVRPANRVMLTPRELHEAAAIDATVEHFPQKVKKVKMKPIINFRARDFDSARRVTAKKDVVTIRTRGMFKLGEVLK